MSAPLGVEFDADGNELPPFLLHFPRHPELDPLVRAFQVGDFRSVRRGAPALCEKRVPPLIREAAQELLRRTRPDPLVLWLLAIAWSLFLVVAGWTYFGPSAESRRGSTQASTDSQSR